MDLSTPCPESGSNASAASPVAIQFGQRRDGAPRNWLRQPRMAVEFACTRRARRSVAPIPSAHANCRHSRNRNRSCRQRPCGHRAAGRSTITLPRRLRSKPSALVRIADNRQLAQSVGLPLPLAIPAGWRGVYPHAAREGDTTARRGGNRRRERSCSLGNTRRRRSRRRRLRRRTSVLRSEHQGDECQRYLEDCNSAR